MAGIDTYLLHNQLKKEKKWDSYTLVGNNERVGLTMIDNEPVLWRASPSLDTQVAYKNFNLERSGIANISFQGDRGPSTSIAEIVWFDLDQRSTPYFVIERFLHINGDKMARIDTHYYLGEVFFNKLDIKWELIW